MAIIIMIVLLFFLILQLIVAYISARKVIYPKFFSLKESEELLREDDEWRDFDNNDTEEVDFILNDNYIIHGTMVFKDRNCKNFVIHTHGFGFTRLGGIKYLDAFFNAGFNVYIYDLRSHGDNVKGPIGMGEVESADLFQIIRLFKIKYGSDINLALHGESLGAFTSLMVLKNHPAVDFVIEDCSYSNTIEEIKFQMKRNKIPLYFINWVVFVARVKYKQHWYDFDARLVVKTATIPICFIHGKSDTFTPYYMAKDLYDACDFKENKKLIYFDEAGHAKSEKSNPQRYVYEVKSFIDNLYE